MKNERVDYFKEAYERDDISRCRLELLFLAMEYNTDVREGGNYNHDLKHLLFKTNCVRNPLGIKYTSKDYEKMSRILQSVLKILRAINNPEIDTNILFQKGLHIDKKIIDDILDVAVYVECFYKMNCINSKRMDECEMGNYSFVEQMISIVLFHQDQVRLFMEDNTAHESITGMELLIANIPIDYCKELKCSMEDNFETILESMNEIVHFLYYQYGRCMKTVVKEEDITFKYVQIYENVDFHKYFFVALQRYLLCKVEEGIRYGYYAFKGVEKNAEGNSIYGFSVEDEKEYKARCIGIKRREYQVRNRLMFDYRNQLELIVAEEKINVLVEEFLGVQEGGMVLLEFEKFHPNAETFQVAEGIARIKEYVVEDLTKDYYLDCIVKDVKIRDLLYVYKYLDTLSQILYLAAIREIDFENQETYIKEICIVDITYLVTELSRIHGFKVEYAERLIDRFVFHENNNKEDDVFAQPLIKISKTQVLLSNALVEQVNLDRFIERQFIRYRIDVSTIGHMFEREFIGNLKKGYSRGFLDFDYEAIPGFSVNENQIKYEAFDGREIEFDVLAVLGEYLILTELKAMMTSYELSDLEKRKKNIKDAIEQLRRRKQSVKYDWQKIKEMASIELPDKPYDEDHIILIACTDAYDYTPLKKGDIFITDSSSFLKYFTSPYVDVIETQKGMMEVRRVQSVWEKGYPEAKEFMQYLCKPVTVQPYDRCLEKQDVVVPCFDEKDYIVVAEDYRMIADPVIEIGIINENDTEQEVCKTIRIYPNDPCPCGSGKKYKKCCGIKK